MADPTNTAVAQPAGEGQPDSFPPEWSSFDRVASIFWEPMDREMIEWLAISRGQRALDAGCGRGDHARYLAEWTRADGSVVALDRAPVPLKKAQARVAGTPFEQTIQFCLGKLEDPSLFDAEFDHIWCSHTLHGQSDVSGVLRNLKRMLRPTGCVAIREDKSGGTMLPYDVGLGNPGLEARLFSAFVQRFTQHRLALGRCPYGWEQALYEAGFVEVRTKSFLYQLSPPFSEQQREYLHFLLARGQNAVTSDEDDQRVLKCLLDASGPDYFLNRRDVHFTCVCTVHLGFC